MALYLHRPHHTTRLAARRRVEAVARDLAEELNVDYRWQGDRLTFQRLGAKGTITLDDTDVHVQLSRSPFLPVSEAWLKQQIEHYLDEHLPPPGPLRNEPPPTQNDTKDSPPASPSEAHRPPKTKPTSSASDHSFLGRLTHLAEAMGSAALQTTSDTAQTPLKLVETLLGREEPAATTQPLAPEVRAAGHYLRELRQRHNLSLAALAAHLEVIDVQQLRDFEAGTARPSLHVILGLAAHLAQDVPIPFLFKMAQGYYPDVWRQMKAVGVVETPTLSEREQQLLEVYRDHPNAYLLPDEAFEEVLRLTRANFDAAVGLGRRGP